MSVFWLVDTVLMNEEESSRLAKALNDSKSRCIISTYRPFIDKIETHGLTSYNQVAVYGTIQFALNATQFCGNFLRRGEYDVTSYRESLGIGDDCWLNRPIFTTFGYLKRNIFDILPEHSSLFVRPNSGIKTFTGLVDRKERLANRLRNEMQFSKVDDNTLVQVSSPVKIHSEYRTIIYDKKFITGSGYGNGKSFPLDKRVQNFASGVAYYCKWEDPVVIDFALVEDTTGELYIRAVEANCITCAGWYDSDYDKIVEVINDRTLKVHKELNE